MKLLLEDICFSYKVSMVLDKCSYQFSQDKIYILLGRNGAGKSTLLNLMVDNLSINSGKIEFSRHNEIQKLENSDYGFMSDSFFYYPSFTLSQMAKVVMKMRELEADDYYQELLDKLELRNYENSLISSLSLGTKQRFHLLLTILHLPSLLLLDEPTNGLDPEQTYYFKKLIRGLVGDRIIIISTHSLDLARELGDEILLLKNRRLARIESDDDLEKEFLSEF